MDRAGSVQQLTRRFAIYAGDTLDPHAAKTAFCLLRFRPEEAVAVIDAPHAGNTCRDVIEIGGTTPIVANLSAALDYKPTEFLIGTNPAGGSLTPSLRQVIEEAIDRRLAVYAGLHDSLNDDPGLSGLAARRGVQLIDLRAVPVDLSVPDGARANLAAKVVLTVGSDCNVGKMTTAWLLSEALPAARFVPTGQTGVLLAGSGFAIDRVVADFLAGAAERLVCEHAEGAEVLLVEGQGSVLHPYYSGVTLGLLHGARPDAMVLCHVAGRNHLRHSIDQVMPPLREIIDAYQTASRWVRPCPIVGVSLATHELDDDAARRAIESAEAEVQLPVEDIVRFPTGALARAINDA